MRFSRAEHNAAEEIGKSISLYRRISGITAAELAERAGFGRDTMSRIERGDPSVSFGARLSASKVLGISHLVIKAFDPMSTDYGRMQLERHVPKRVRS